MFFYPAVDDEFERFDSCRTGIRDGRLRLERNESWIHFFFIAAEE